jgi:hypothetical protein
MVDWRRTTLLGWILTLAGMATAQLGPGDIAFVAYNSDGSNDFAWVALRRIPAHTAIHFTDMSVSNGGFRLSEHLSAAYQGPLSWSCTNDVEAGTVVRWQGVPRVWTRGAGWGGAPNLSGDGDQLIAYCGTIVSNGAFPPPWQGDAGGATLLHALNFANSGWDNANGGSTEKSFVPPGLSTGACTAVHVGSKDNGYYSGVISGTSSGLLASIACPANWVTSNELFETTYWSGEICFRIRSHGTVLSLK